MHQGDQQEEARHDRQVPRRIRFGGAGAWHVATHRASLGANARLEFFGATFGARLQKAYWEVSLDGTGAEADLAGICFGDGEQHLDHQSLQAHRAPETRSNLLLKVAVRDRSRLQEMTWPRVLARTDHLYARAGAVVGTRPDARVAS